MAPWASVSSMVHGWTPVNPPGRNVAPNETRTFDETLKYIESDKVPAKKAAYLIQQYVREDWQWPNPPSPVYARSIDGQASGASAREGNTVYREREVVEEFDQISSWSSDADGMPRNHEGIQNVHKEPQSMSSMDIADLRLDDHNSVMDSNPGISAFEARRDAWTRAVCISASGGQKENLRSPIAYHNTSDLDTTGSIAQYSTDTSKILLPVPPRWLPDHEARADSRKEENYAKVYTRFIATSTKPKMPINLCDVTRSCVVGWKLDGTWAEAEKQGLIQADVKPAGNPESGGGRSMVHRPKEAIKKSVNGVKDGVVNTVKSKVGNVGANRGPENG